jgi:hypothetical protein
MVTVLPAGTVAGAVYVVAEPLAVCAGLKEPQSELPQATVQSKPRFLGSLRTVALIMAGALVAKEAGGAWLKKIAPGVTVTVAVTDLLVSVLAVAVMVTVLPAGTVAGTVNLVAELLAV